MLWIFFLLFSVLRGEEAPSALSHFEGGLPCIAGGYVNVISGSPSLSETDLVLPGIEPLVLSRRCHYEPRSSNFDDPVKSWDISLIKKVTKSLKPISYKYDSLKNKIWENNEIYTLHEDTQPTFLFEFWHDGKETKTRFNRFEYGKGVTNLSQGYPSGRVAPRNLSLQKFKVSFGEAKTVVTSGDGEKMEFTYNFHEMGLDTDAMLLRKIVSPSGFEKTYHYDKNSLSSVSLKSPQGATLGSLSFSKEMTYTGYQVRVTSPDGRNVVMDYWHDSHKRASDRSLIKKVVRSDAPTVNYQYHASDKNKQILAVNYPNKRGVGFTYWEDGDDWTDGDVKTQLANDSYQIYKVKSILQPVGETEEKIPTHFFQYFTNKKKNWNLAHTRVTSTYGHVDDYFFDDDFLLKELYHYSNPRPYRSFKVAPYNLKHTCDQREKFFWYKGGDIKTWALCDGKGHPYSIRHYVYDDNGNVVTESTYGSMSGETSSSPLLDEKGDPSKGDSERLVKRFTYSDDGLNLLLSEENPEGLKTLYTYVEGSDRLQKKITMMDDLTIQREFFEYDEDHCLISYEIKSGTTHLIERYTPSKKIPFGYPLEKRVYTVAPEGEHLLLSHHFKYNSKGELLREQKKNERGKVLFSHEKKYDPHGNCISEKDALGYETLRTFDANDNCIKQEGPRPGLVKMCVYDFMNRCVEERLSFNKETWTTKHRYNELNQRIETEDPFGFVTKFVYDRYGRPLETHLPTGAMIKKKFDSSGNEIETIDPLGGITRKKYTILNKPYEITYPDGSVEYFRYNKDGSLKSQTDKNGLKTVYERDKLGRILKRKIKDAVESYEYQGSLLKRVTNFNGVTTTFSYDRAGRKITEKTDGAKTTFTYDSLGRLTRTSYYDKGKPVSVHVEIFDALDRVVKKWIEDGEGNRYLFESYGYDALGNRISETRGGHTTTYAYDGLNRLIKRTDAEDNQTLWDYSMIGKTEIRTDPNGVRTFQRFDGGERLLLKEKSFGKSLLSSVSYRYDLNDNVLEETHQVIGREAPPFTLFREYDAMNRLTLLQEPGRRTSYTYTPLGQLKTSTKPDGTVLFYGYDDFGNLASLRSQDRTIDYVYVYDHMGHLLSVSDEKTEVIRSYTPRGMLEKEISFGDTTLYTYDDLDRVTKITFPDLSTLEYDYNAIGMSRIKRNGDSHDYLAFDGFGNAIEEKLIDGTIRNKTYDSLNRIQSIKHKDYSVEPILYDKVGNLIQAGNNLYTYDKLDQLKSETNFLNHDYAFDSIHNPIQKDEESFAIDPLNQIDAYSGETYTYDLNGNLLTKTTSEGNWSFRYDHLDRLISVNDNYHYVYDGLHRRLYKKTPNDEERYWYLGDNEVGSISKEAKTFRALGIGIGAEIGAAVLIELNGETFTPHYDPSGNLVHLGENSWTYSAFGESSSPLSIPWGFSCKRIDPETGFYYFGRRYYDPSLMRWSSCDPLSFSTGINLYAFLFNNPLTHFDRLGLLSESSSLFRLPSLLPNSWVHDFKTLPTINHLHFEQNYQDYPPSQILPYDDLPKLPSDLGIGFCNGIDNDLEDAYHSRQYLSNLAGGYSIDMVYNATHGFYADVQECWRGLNNVATEPVDHLHSMWNNFFSQSSPSAKYLQFCHSQGAIHVRNALLGYPNDLRQRILVVAIAPAAYIYGSTCVEVYHYRAHPWRDLIPRLDVFGAWRERHTIRNIDSAPNAPYFDHSFNSPTFKIVMQQHSSNYLMSNGERL